MAKMQRDKGARREREFAELIGGRRTPLSGAVEGFPNDVEGLGLSWEVKARKTGFKQIYDWLEDEREQPDALAIKVDHKDWVVAMKLDQYKQQIPQVQKTKNGRDTVIEWQGQRYVLDVKGGK